MLLCRVPTRNSAPMPSGTRNRNSTRLVQNEGVCITASGNIMASGNLSFRVLKLQLKVMNLMLCKKLLFKRCYTK